MPAKRSRPKVPAATACLDYAFRQRFRVPPSKAFRWCLDFSPDDVELSSGHLSRKVSWTSPRTVVLDDRFAKPNGERVHKVKLVQVYPETRSWVSTHIAGPNHHSQFRYRIVPNGANASALIFEGRELRWQGPTLSAVATRKLARQLCREDSGTWKEFAAAMESDPTLR
ncbi:MAG TPA: hypothetical protein VEG66_05995 [Thermoplasmata archaeon]|jgi:hypothetical protein|nr:hypothetical protein [Thermoplasmata archaeon]